LSYPLNFRTSGTFNPQPPTPTAASLPFRLPQPTKNIPPAMSIRTFECPPSPFPPRFFPLHNPP
ncbi:hypothetical protein CCMA1212_004019, partial [Trichoderma ghanense]